MPHIRHHLLRSEITLQPRVEIKNERYNFTHIRSFMHIMGNYRHKLLNK